MIATFKVLSALLSYPGEEIMAAAPDLMAVVAQENLVPPRLQKQLAKLTGQIADGDLFDLQERYVVLFDRTRSLSLHIFEHVHGESRDRGQAMVDLMDLYESRGLRIDARELPDYLPLFLEFLSTLEIDEARALLAEPLHIISALKQRHRKRKSAYTIVFSVLEALARGKAKAADVALLLREPEDDPDDLEALDRIWEEEAVSFGQGASGTVAPDGSCPAARDLLARMDTPPDAGPKPGLGL